MKQLVQISLNIREEREEFKTNKQPDDVLPLNWQFLGVCISPFSSDSCSYAIPCRTRLPAQLIGGPRGVGIGPGKTQHQQAIDFLKEVLKRQLLTF